MAWEPLVMEVYTTRCTGYGTPVEVTAPPAAETVDASGVVPGALG